MHDEPPPSRVASYRIVRELGRGGSGIVFSALDEATGRRVALKILRPELAGDTSRRKRLLREARAASSIAHPNVAGVLDVGEGEGGLYLAMELVDGRTLRAALEQGPLVPADAVLVGRQIAAAVAAAHERGIVHRDLKPENVMLTGQLAVKVLDFGLAKEVASGAARGDAETVSELTEEGRIVGTTGYMSPEQISGKPLDASADVFSIGVILYEMTTGRRPFTGESNVEVMIAVHRDAPVPPSTLAPGVSAPLEAVILRCLAKRPADRYAAATLLRDALERLDAPGTISTSATAVPAAWRGGARAATLGAALVVPIAAAAAWLGLARRDPPAAAPAASPEPSALPAPAASPCADFTSPAAWTSFAPARHGGYEFGGGAFDGAFAYFGPAGYGNVLRYDTRARFDAQSSWVAFKPAGIASAMDSAVHVGRYVYFGGNIVSRYDPAGPFDAPSSWRSFDLAAKAHGREGATMGDSDGRWLYVVPLKGGRVLRFDTRSDIADGAAWASFRLDTLVPGGVCTDCIGGVFDGRYEYVVPQYDPGNVIARFDTTKPFAAPSSWETFGLGAVDPGAQSFASAAFDDGFLYLAPFANAVIPATGVVLRYDVSRPLADTRAWKSFHSGQVAPAQGFGSMGFDGRYLYLPPYCTSDDGGTAYSSTVLRYDTRGAFDAASSWCSFDVASVNRAARGFKGAVFDGAFVYLVPFETGAPVVRYAAKPPPSQAR